MRRVASLRWLAGTLLLSLAVHAAPLTRDLGEGLQYFRVQRAPADLPADEAARGTPCVLDVRYATGDEAAAREVVDWVRRHAASRTPVFLLVNDATSPALRERLDHARQTGVLTIGTAGGSFAPDVSVAQPAGDERRAYDALQSGSDVATLTTDHPGKRRNDEASLAHEAAPPPANPDASEDGTPRTAAAKAQPPPTDAALQRAIHLHRGLKAMRKL